METLRVVEISRNEGEFNADEGDYTNEYQAVYLDDAVVLYIHIQTHPMLGMAVFHLTHKVISPRAIRAIRRLIHDITKPMLRERGIRYIAGMTDGGVHNWMKLMRLIGLNPKQLPDGRQIVVEEV